MKNAFFFLYYRWIRKVEKVLFRSKKAGKLQLVHYQNLGKINEQSFLMVSGPDTDGSILDSAPEYG